ncbi:CARDB domain-containing protein [Haloarchaeobius salinus]|uniref:CARDB domain-containing protein n=1 Tax=Haloarchaeobius salinus TaxID=1198298 RepID=UPI00210B81EC|nr:CARDB domain-containing protein [Haloarchaeobius salinus]
MDRRVALLTVLLVSLVAAPAATPVSETSDAATLDPSRSASDAIASNETVHAAAETAGPTISRTLTLHLTPDRPGEIRTVVSFDIPEEVTELGVQLQSNADVQSTENFERDGGRYVWTGDGSGGSVTFTYDANETSDMGGRAALAEGLGATSADAQVAEYAFADTGDWALVRAPSMGVDASGYWEGSLRFEREVTVAGEGTTGGYMAYLGPMTTYSETADGQEITLAVPDAAEMRESPEAVLASLANASERLRVGQRDETALVIAAPRTVDWSSAGLQYGDTDAWVVADARLDRANNVWLHEYVHTRQEFRTDRSGRWLTEASADYYAALLAYEQGHIGFDAFREKLERGTADPQSTAVLAEPATWSNSANYLKGALVTGGIDRELRTATDGEATFQRVLRRLNDQESNVDNSDILAAVEAVSGSDVRSYADRYTTGSEAPEPWSRETHAELFGPVPASFAYMLADGSPTVAGPYRNTTVNMSPTLAVGETLEIGATVENVGDGDGTYETQLVVDGSVEATESGELGPGETETLAFERTFDEAGTYDVRVANRELTVTVREPATPRVTSIEAPESVTVGEAFTVRATVDNEAAWPAAGDVSLSLDGEESHTDTVRLPPRSRLTYTGRVTISEAGEHVVRIGGEQVTVTAVEPATTAGTAGDGDAEDGATGDGGGGSGELPMPGFGVTGAVAALVGLLAGIGLHRRQ